MKKLKFKELNSGFELERKIEQFSTKEKSGFIIAFTLIIAFLFVLLLSSFGVVSFDGISARISDKIFGSGKDFPITIESENTLNIKVLDDKFVLLGDKFATVYAADGSEVFTVVHTFSKPAVSVNVDRGVIFDRAGTGYILFTENKVVFTGEAENDIISAEYGSNGDYAIAQKGTDCTSTVTVYSKKQDVKFKWNCAYENITSITLSDDGKFAGVALLGCENGECYTSVQYFGYSYKEVLNSAKITGVTPFDISFSKKNTLTVFTDSGVYKLKKSSEKAEAVKEFYNPEFNSYSVLQNGDYVLTLANYGSTNVFSILLFNGNGKLKKEISLDYELTNVCVSEKYIFAIAENEIIVYNHSGRNVGKIDVSGKIYGVYPTDKFVYIQSLDCILRTYSHGKSSVSVS